MLKHLFAITFFVTMILAHAEEVKPTPPSGGTTAVPTPAITTPNNPVISKPSTPPMNFPRPPNQDWIALIERLRMQPRAGEINNGNVAASLTDIFSDSAETKSKTATISADYEKALLEAATKWENDIKQLRAQFESKMLAELPEAKRETAQKLLDMSRTKSVEAATRDTKTRTEFLERMRNSARPMAPGFKPGAPNTPASPIGQPGADASAWMREERMKAIKQDEDSVSEMRALLSPEDAVRFDVRNRSRPMTNPVPSSTRPVGVPPPPQNATPAAAPESAPKAAVQPLAPVKETK